MLLSISFLAEQIAHNKKPAFRWFFIVSQFDAEVIAHALHARPILGISAQYAHNRDLNDRYDRR